MIYDRPIRELMKDAAADLTPPYTTAEIVAWFGQHYPKINPNSVRAHIIGLTANHPSRHHYHLGGMTALFVRQPDKTLMPFDLTDSTGVDDGEIADGTGGDDEMLPEQSAEFVLEAHLEDFLAANWAAIGWGRRLEIWRGPDGQSGHQLTTPVGRMDFLCADRDSGDLVVIELKRGRPSDKVVGQVARYIGYVRSHIATPDQPVEGLIIAHEADDALRYAIAAVPGLHLMTYEITFRLTAVGRAGTLAKSGSGSPT